MNIIFLRVFSRIKVILMHGDFSWCQNRVLFWCHNLWLNALSQSTYHTETLNWQRSMKIHFLLHHSCTMGPKNLWSYIYARLITSFIFRFSSVLATNLPKSAVIFRQGQYSWFFCFSSFWRKTKIEKWDEKLIKA